MLDIIEIETPRLILRQWKKEDRPLFAKINADSDVMEFYPSILEKKESDEFAQKLESLITKRGWGLWAVETKDEKKFIGFVGLHKPTYDLPIKSCVEIGWRLAKEYWGNGFATEAANAALDIAFGKLNLPEVYSFTSIINKKSKAVMERLGMVNTNKNFNHPMLPENSQLSEHYLYKIDHLSWKKLR